MLQFHRVRNTDRVYNTKKRLFRSRISKGVGKIQKFDSGGINGIESGSFISDHAVIKVFSQ